jgi:hypothetical protein
MGQQASLIQGTCKRDLKLKALKHITLTTLAPGLQAQGSLAENWLDSKVVTYLQEGL